MSKIYKQVINFVVISGLGWLIDLSVFVAITKIFDLSVFFANIISAIPAVSFVFWISIKKTFDNKASVVKPVSKYLIYFIYQIILLVCVSSIGESIYTFLLNFKVTEVSIVMNNLKIITKLVITPITMIFNFIFMKFLIEKL